MKNRRRNHQSEADLRIRLLSLIGFVPGQKSSDETKGLLRGLMIWVYGVHNMAGKSPLQLPTRRIRTFLAHYAPSAIQRKLDTFNQEGTR